MTRFGVPGQNIDPLAYGDERRPVVPMVDAPKRPTTSDKKYPIFTHWRTNKNVSAPAVEGEIWVLVKFESNGDATWVSLDYGSTPAAGIDDIRDQVNAQVGPSVSGYIDIDAAIVANGANPSGIPFETVADAGTNTLDLQMQLSVDRTGAPADSNDAGICSFDDTQFVVDANGYVKLVGGSGPPALTVTGDDAVATSPDGTGDWELDGLVVANATNAKPFYISQDGVDTSKENFEIQVAAAVTGAPADTNDAGLCSFDDTSFAVSANGYVTITGSFDIGWTEVAINTNMVTNNGYITNAAGSINMLLPATASVGDRVRLLRKGAGDFVITQGAGQTIHFGSSSTTTGAGGSVTSLNQYDAIELLCITANTDFAVLSSQGAGFTIV